GPAGRRIPPARAGQSESGIARGAGYSRVAQQFPGASSRGVPRRDRGGRGGHHRRAQPPEWRPDPLGRRPGGHAAARRRRTPAGPAPVRPCHHRGRSLRELRLRRPAVTGTLPDLAPDLRAILERHADRLDLDLIERALRFSASAHRGQKRMSGEDFVSHSIAVALILAEQLLDSTTIAAALLHDVVEDSDVRTEDIAREFGPEVAGIVDGLTKISSLTFHSSAEEQVENYRKLLLSIAKDARVIIIKLGDRLHNMRTL